VNAAAQDIATVIDDMQVTYIAITMGLRFVQDPVLVAAWEKQIAEARREAEARGAGFGLLMVRRDHTYRPEMDPIDALRQVQGSAEFNLEYLRLPLMAEITLIGDRLSTHRYFDHAPILEFVRHLGNAVSHGNRWHFTSGEPRRPAASRFVTLDASFHGREPVLWDDLTPADVLDVFDDVAAHLRAIP
jgi:hypothetical protein